MKKGWYKSPKGYTRIIRVYVAPDGQERAFIAEAWGIRRILSVPAHSLQPGTPCKWSDVPAESRRVLKLEITRYMSDFDRGVDADSGLYA